ncbi:MAG TPA: DUF58 domain-containing protein [Nocardioides sp.]|nr:DUF58 domain-containing protein [Nocardioides sp.]
MNTLMAHVRRFTGIVNALGWTVLVAGVALVFVAVYTDWRELAVLAAACLLVFLLALPFLVGRTNVRVEVVLQPERVIAGGAVAAGVRVRNIAAHGLLPTMLELPVGSIVHRYPVPRLGPDETHEESFTIRTERRGVIPVGPASTRRGDPLAMLSRDVEWTDVVEILVRPPMVPMDSLGAGLLRDLEGVSTDAVSHSDLAFHALREYVPGDDLRHVHWRSSAKAMAASDDTRLLVRQYLDTRRSHVTVVVDDTPGVWSDAQDFETAMSVAASILVRATLDEFDTSFVCGTSASSGVTGHLALDSVCRAEFGSVGLVSSAHRAAVVSPDTSLLFLVGGAASDFENFQRAVTAFPPEVRRYALIVDPSAPSRVTETGGFVVVQVADKADLGALLRWSQR